MNSETKALPVSKEAPVEVIVNKRKLITFMCTPCHLNELVVGFLVSRRLISSINEINTLGACDDSRQVFVRLAHEIPEEEYGLAAVLASSCGSGSFLISNFSETSLVRSPLRVSTETLRQLAKTVSDKAVMYKETGGMHCAALATLDGGIIALREDVGRHNAVDKVIGKATFMETDFTTTIIFTTGRISSDMMIKAISVKIPVVVTRSIPTDLAVEMAEKAGVTIVGRIGTRRPFLYTHPSRVIEEDQHIE